jgi:type IV pilus assembly protein PilB
LPAIRQQVLESSRTLVQSDGVNVRENKKNLGTLLLEMGRISEAEIERALEHQRLTGGYFGQALVDLGIVEQDELDFGLASQANLPYIEADPARIDKDVASLVPATWAQRHNAMPIEVRDGWLTLLVDSPLKTGLSGELNRRTGLSVKLALCSSRRLSQAIRIIYELDPVNAKPDKVLSLEAFWSLATSPPARRWGLTVRNNQVMAWIDHGAEFHRHNLMHNWLVFLDRILSPPPSQILPAHGMRRWRANVRPDQSPGVVIVNSLTGPGGHDLEFQPANDLNRDRLVLPSSQQIVTLKQAIRRRPTVLAVHSPTGLAARELVTRLPQLLLNSEHRSICMLREGVHAISEDMLVIAPPDENEYEETFDFIERLRLDAVGLEIDPVASSLWERAIVLAPLVLVVLSGMKADQPLPPGINWLLAKFDETQPDWELI